MGTRARILLVGMTMVLLAVIVLAMMEVGPFRAQRIFSLRWNEDGSLTLEWGSAAFI